MVLVAYCLALEMVNKESRLYAGTVIMMFFSAGVIMMGGIVYFIHDWRWLQVALTLPGILFLSFWWLIPESTRWLLANNQREKAIEQIQTIADANGLTVPQDILDKLEAEKPDDGRTSKPTLLDLFRSPNLRMKSLLIFFDWFIISGTYYGLSWSTNQLGGNKLLNFVLAGVVEFPAYYSLILTLNRFGRKKILTGSMVLAGTVLLVSLLISEKYVWTKVGLAMFGKMSITASYGTIYVFSAEQFPTVIRNVALGASSMSARIGGILAPYLLFLSTYWKPAPFLVFGILALLGGVCSTFLPETHNKELPETLADGERLGKDKDVRQPDEMDSLDPKDD